MKKSNNVLVNSKGFTLLEILLVVAIIAILAGIVIVAINPAKQLGDARNAQRKADVATILSAVYQFVIDHNGAFPANIAQKTDSFVSASSTCAIPDVFASSTEICKSSATSCSGLSSLDSDLTSGSVAYVTSMPRDPSAPALNDGTGYYIAELMPSKRIIICAPNTENVSTSTGMIGVSR